MSARWIGPLSLAAGACIVAPPASAQRDPFAPPGSAGTAAPVQNAAAAPAAPALPPLRQIVTVQGERYVVSGARRLAVGERLGGLRIECIHEQGVWLRDETGQRRHAPLFASLGGGAIRPAPGSEPASDECTQRPQTAAAPPRALSKRNPS